MSFFLIVLWVTLALLWVGLFCVAFIALLDEAIALGFIGLVFLIAVPIWYGSNHGWARAFEDTTTVTVTTTTPSEAPQ